MKNSILKSRILAIAAICLSALVALDGCAVQQGTKVDSNSVSFIQKGQTTRAELIGKLGQPTTTTRDATGKETLIWEYYKHTTDAKAFIPVAGLFMGSTEMEGSTFTVSLDKGSRVVDYQISNSRSEGRLGQ